MKIAAHRLARGSYHDGRFVALKCSTPAPGRDWSFNIDKAHQDACHHPFPDTLHT